jgi:hypothetical protein
MAALAICLGYGLLAWRLWFVSDDAFISFRYARNWVEGYGLRYNLGEHVPVEGYSNFLWVVVCALGESLGWDPFFWAPLISTGCGLALLAYVYFVMVARLRLDGEVAWLATLAFEIFPPFAI